MRFVGYKDNVEICRQFEPKRQRHKCTGYYAESFFFTGLTYFVLLFFTRKISFLMNVQLFPECNNRVIWGNMDDWGIWGHLVFSSNILLKTHV